MAYDYDNVSNSMSVYRNMKDPRMLKRYYRFKTVDLIKGNEVTGASPPEVFVGRMGYPNVYIGPMVPPQQFEDTSLLGTPERWVGRSIPEIVEFRSALVRGMFRTKISNPGKNRIEDMLQELALADKCANVDAKLKRSPSGVMHFDENSQPFGPSAPMESMELGNTRANPQVEKAFMDTDLKARDAIIELYEKGTFVSKIQKALSAGLLGMGDNRKLVPTRWSITAVDDTLSKKKLETVKESDYLDEIKVFYNVALDNRWAILMVPGQWSYESMEAWYPKTTWNMDGTDIEIGASYEGFDGRKTYAEIGGCYYAARLAVSEYLTRKQAQAKVVILREAHPGYIMPVGVWNVREHVRDTLVKEPEGFATMTDALSCISKKLDIPMRVWIKHSVLLKKLLYQRQLSQRTVAQ